MFLKSALSLILSTVMIYAASITSTTLTPQTGGIIPYEPSLAEKAAKMQKKKAKEHMKEELKSSFEAQKMDASHLNPYGERNLFDSLPPEIIKKL